MGDEICKKKMEENDKRDMEQLAADFERRMKALALPEMDTVDLLDLMDYYSRCGKDFEADLCRYLAKRQEPNHPEVLLSEAHTYADMGRWPEALDYLQQSGAAGYDRLMFVVERYLRCGEIETAAKLALEALPKNQVLEMADCDFIYDAAVLFRDYGFNHITEQLLAMLPEDYVDYLPAMEIRVNSLIELTHFADAKALINSLIDRRAFDQKLWLMMAWCCYHAGEYAEANDALAYAEAIAPVEDRSLKLLIDMRLREDALPDDHYLEVLLKTQDYVTCLSYADLIYSKGLYERALFAYQATGMLIPHNSRDREHYMARCLLCLAYSRRYDKELVEYMNALHATGGDYWQIYLEAAQCFFEYGDTSAALEVILFAVDDHLKSGSRCTQLVSLLTHYDCYAPARELWGLLNTWRSHVAPSYQAYIDTALRRLEE
jgi:tetratricopeptide (TPR) repeat protein